MGYLIALAMLVLFMLLAGFAAADVVAVIIFIACALVALIGLFFLTMAVFLCCSKKVKGNFSHFDEEGRWPTAVYKVGEEEFKCVFPAEMVMKKRLYDAEKRHNLMKIRFMSRVMDPNALMTVIVGAGVFVPGGVFALIWMIEQIKLTAEFAGVAG